MTESRRKFVAAAFGLDRAPGRAGNISLATESGCKERSFAHRTKLSIWKRLTLVWLLFFLVPCTAQAAIQFRAASKDVQDSAAALTASKPAGTTVGDLLIAWASHDVAGGTWTPPAGQGWTAFSLPGTETEFTSRAWYKQVDASDATRIDYTFTFSTSESCILYIAAFYEDSGTGNWTLEDGTGWAFAAPANSISNGGVTAVNNSLFVVGYGNDDNETVASDPSGPTKIDEDMTGGTAFAAYYEMVDAIDGSVSYPITWGGSADELSAMAGIFSWAPSGGGSSISGTVFEDIVGDVLNDGAIGGANNPGASGVDVYLYRDNGNTVFDGSDTVIAGPVATDPSGAYSFTGLTDDTYFVRVDSRTIPSAQDPTAPVGDIWATQTYTTAGGWCANGSGAGVLKGTSGPCYGGITGILSDSSSLPLHYVRVTVSGASVTGIDLGFSFNVVVNTRGGNSADDDAGANRTVQGSLRQFIQNANAISGSNAMRFVPVDPANAGAGSWWKISVSTALPTVTGSGTTIDGTAYQLTDGVTVRNTNTGVLGTGGTVGVDGLALPQVAKPELELAGLSVADGLAVEADAARIRRLSVWGFWTSAIRIGDPATPVNHTGTVVEENIIGSAPGVLADPGAVSRPDYAVRINHADDGFVQNNIVAFADQFGIRVESSGTDRWTVSGNEVRSTGLSLNGGLDAKGADGTFRGNLVVDTGGTGVVLVSTGNVVENNTIRDSGQLTPQAGITALLTSNAVIRKNVITGSSRGGVFVGIVAPSGVRISQNHFGGNGANAIDLLEAGAGAPATSQGDGISPNTAVPPNCGIDAGASNQGLDAPVIGTASPVTVTGAACAGATVEVYRAVADGDASDTLTGTDYGEGVEYLGSAVADGVTGAWSLSGITGLVGGDAVSAITINASNSTSEFGENATVAPGDTCPTVTTTADSGPGSLRQCINYANSNPGTTITFNIPLPANQTSAPDSWWRISPASALPPITANGTIIDGTTQTTNQGNTNTNGPEIEINGAGAGVADGFNVTSANNEIKGLIINGFTQANTAGVKITGASATGNSVSGCYIGTNHAAAVAAANFDGIFLTSGASSNTIGGTTVAERNIISGNTWAGIRITLSGTNSNIITGNYIGTDASGSSGVPNSGWGITIYGSAGNVRIGGTGGGEGNIIAFNTQDGVWIGSAGSDGNLISGNSIFENGALGIDLDPNGVGTSNGANNNKAAPTITSVTPSGSDFIVTATTTSGDTVEFFRANNLASPAVAADPSGFGEGYLYLGRCVDGGACNGPHIVSAADNTAGGTVGVTILSSGITAGNTLSATATDGSNNTSEFGANYAIAAIVSLSGTVFEDLNYGGGAGRDRATSSGVVRSGTRVELYNNSGSFVDNTTTDGSGNYSFTNLTAGSYTVRVVSSSVTSSRTGYVSALRPVMTFRTNASSGTAVGVTDYVGGHDPATQDVANAAAGWILNAATGVFSGSGSGKAHAFAPVTVSAANVTGVDFGWNFDTIVNTNNTGQGSLMVFIFNANTLGGDASLNQVGLVANKENAVFMISNGTASLGLRSANNYFTGGVATISPALALPTISTPMVIDAQKQPGWTSAPIIELNGTGAGGSANGLLIGAANSVVRGFVINRFGVSGIQINGANSLVAGNWIGLDSTGTLDRGNAADGIVISGNNATIGGAAPADRNVISGNNDEGIDIDPGVTGVVIKGNYIGTNATGTGAVGNGTTSSSSQGGILAEGVGTQIGGSLAGEGNLISGNYNDGIYLTGTGNVIEGNRIGTDAAGTSGIPNGGPGIRVLPTNGGTNNRIGGAAAGQGNTIAFNTGDGIRLDPGAVTGNAISANAVFSNTGLGIDLGGNGVTANDGAKTGGEPNLLMDFPVFTSASLSGTTLTVAGYVGSAPGQSTFAGARVEIFKADNEPTEHGEGQTYLGFLTADANGNFSGSLTVSGIALGDPITGTATDGSNNTSEFGANIKISPGFSSLSGTVFEDVNYGGAAGRDRASSSGVVRPGARVELFDGAGNYKMVATTDASGNYSFTSLTAGNYTVRVVNGSVTSSRVGYAAGLWPVQTFRTDASSGTAVAVTDHVGGEVPQKSDAGNGSTTLAALTTATTTAQSIAPVTIGAGNVTGVDFGFNFDTIVNTNDAGQGSLRQFIVNVNTLQGDAGLAQAGRTPGKETSIFMIPTTDTGYTASPLSFAIRPTSVLNDITSPVILDGTTQPEFGAAGRPVVQIDGTNLGANIDAVRLEAGASNSIVRGFVFSRVPGDAISLELVDDVTIAGNYVGTDPTGTIDESNGFGIRVRNSDRATIGGTVPADRNVVSGTLYGILIQMSSADARIVGNYVGLTATGASGLGNSPYGVMITATGGGHVVGGSTAAERNVISANSTGVYSSVSGVTISGNYIGTDANGTASIPNLVAGVMLSTSATGNIVGGTVPGARNVISGNNGRGVDIRGAATTGNIVIGNYIGLDANGATLPNVFGVHISDGAFGNRIGGTAPGEANVVAFNTSHGVYAVGTAGTANAILGNSIHTNGALGINLGDDNVTPNDGAKPAGSPNLTMDYPVFTSASLSGTTLTVAGYVGSAPGQGTFANARVEIFKADNTPANQNGEIIAGDGLSVPHGEGSTYLGFVTTDANGNFSDNLTVSGLASGDSITGTATDGSGNTSEFGANFLLVGIADLALTKIDNPDPAASGGDLLYTLLITNNGPNTATGVTVTDVLPGSVTLQSATPSQGSCSGTTTVTCDLGAILSTGTATIEILVVTSGTGTITNNASVTANESDPVPGNNTASVDTNVVVGGTTDIPLTQYRRIHSFVDSTVTGGTLRTGNNNNNPCNVTGSSTGTLSGIPGTATVVGAYLYWAGSGSTVDSQITLDGSTLTADRTFQARFVLGSTNYDFFGGFKDVTAQVQSKRDGDYTFSGLTVVTGNPYCSSQAVLAGWSMIVIYQDLSLSGKTLVLYDGFDLERNGSTSYLLSGIYASAPPEAKATFLLWEGDSNLGGSGESLMFNGSTLSDGLNPVNNVYNSTINSRSINNSYGVDLDTFDVSSLVQPRDTLASTTVSVGPDLVILNAVLLQVKSNIITGRVFEDVNYGGGAGRDYATAVAGAPGFTVPRPGAAVELYDATGALLRTTTTDANGEYGFAGLIDGDYTVRVPNDNVTSSRPGATGNEKAVQTFRTDASSGSAVAVTNEVGGADPALQDSPANTTSQNLGSFFSQSKAPARIITGTAVTQVDFGFSFDTVVNTNDTGQGSLRQFVTNANALGNGGLAQAGRPAGNESAIFMISNGTSAPGLRASLNYFSGGVATFSPATTLPTITDPAVLDAQTQPGWTSAPILVLAGNAGAGSGLTITAGSSTVRGFVINGFSAGGAAGISISGAGGNTIEGNYVGTDAAGAASVQNYNGIFIDDSDGNFIGGSAISQRNVLSGNRWNGIRLDPDTSGTTIRGNYIGVNAAGTAAVPNALGVYFWQAPNNTVGGTAPGEGNVVSGNSQMGIYLVYAEASGNVIQGNTVGLNAARTAAVPNGAHGVEICCSGNGGSNNTIGGLAAGAANVISGNGRLGVHIQAGTGNGILGNPIYGNGWIGIDLGNDNVTLNNGTKNGSLPNSDMDFPVFTSTVLNGSTLTLSGYVGDAPNDTDFANARVEIFKSDNDGSGYGEGQTYLGFVTTDASGNFSGSMTVSGLSAGDRITGTATDVSNNTSEFGGNAVVAAPGTRPDAMIKLASEGAGGYLTDDLYEATASAQVKPLGVVSGSTATYNVLFQNDGNVADDLVITGTGSAPGFTVQYLDNTATDHTGAVTGAGYTIGGLAVGDSTVWTVNVTPAGTVVGGISYDVFVTTVSGTDNTKIDQVQAVTSSTSANLTLLKSADKGAAAPGEDITYSVNVSNGSGFSAADNVVITDPLDTNTGYKIGSASFTAGGSGLTAAVAFSDDPGPVYVYDYTPLVDGGCSAPAGYDYCVTSVKWTTAGSMPTGTSFNVGLVVRVK